MQIKVYRPLKPKVAIIEGVTIFAELFPELEYDVIEVCDDCKKQECKCEVTEAMKKIHDSGFS